MTEIVWASLPRHPPGPGCCDRSINPATIDFRRLGGILERWMRILENTDVHIRAHQRSDDTKKKNGDGLIQFR